jgi:hypothetical protein
MWLEILSLACPLWKLIRSTSGFGTLDQGTTPSNINDHIHNNISNGGHSGLNIVCLPLNPYPQPLFLSLILKSWFNISRRMADGGGRKLRMAMQVAMTRKPPRQKAMVGSLEKKRKPEMQNVYGSIVRWTKFDLLKP